MQAADYHASLMQRGWDMVGGLNRPLHPPTENAARGMQVMTCALSSPTADLIVLYTDSKGLPGGGPGGAGRRRQPPYAGPPITHFLHYLSSLALPLRAYSPLPEGWRMPHRLGACGRGCETGRWQR